MKNNNEVIISAAVSTIELFTTNVTDGCASVKSGSKSITLEGGEAPKLLLLNEEHTFTVSVTTSSPPVEYPPILMQWDEGFKMLEFEGWDKNNENELNLTNPSDAQCSIRVVFVSKGKGIGILIVGTAELP